MKNLKLLLVSTLALFFLKTSAQNLAPQAHKKCGTEHAHNLLMKIEEHYPNYRKKREQAYRNYLADKSNAQRRIGTSVLPTVVHIITAPCTPQGQSRYTANPSDEVVIQELDKTNLRFKHQQVGAPNFSNPNYGVDAQVEFKLANVDPDGNYTNGIIRHFDASNASSTKNAAATYAQGLAWDNNKYCNIFVFDDLSDVSGVYFGGSTRDFTLYRSSSFWDGLLCHELGHYLNLDHIFNSENGSSCPSNTNCLTSGDKVCDTPPKVGSGGNGGSCAEPANTCTTDEDDSSTNNPYRAVSLGGLGDQPDMLSNYMDYTGGCWDAFTKGQKTRMQADITNFRQSQVDFASIAFMNVPPVSVTLTDVKVERVGCTNEFQPTVTISNSGTSTLTNLKLDFNIDNGGSYIHNWSGSLAPGSSTTINPNSFFVTIEGDNSVSVIVSDANNNSSAFYSGNESCGSFSYTVSGLTSFPYRNKFTDCNLDSIASNESSAKSAWSVVSSSRNRECQGCTMQLEGFTSITDTATFCLKPYDLTYLANPELSFSLGYIARYTYNTNTLSIKVSNDCQPYSTVWSKSDLELSTNNPQAYVNDFNAVTCDNIKTITVDLSAYEQKENVQVCFEGVGEWYSRLFVDDIVLNGEILVGTETKNGNSTLSFNNPVDDVLTIRSKKINDELVVINAFGETLISTKKDEINVSELETGTYYLLNKTSGFTYKFLKL